MTEAWRAWVEQAASPARAVARARLHLIFLLARFAGLRSAEILAFSAPMLDRDTGMLQLKDRKLLLPPQALRPLRRILSLPEAEKPDFIRLDAGFIRRTFYELGQIANLPPPSCAPRALRYARAAELLEMRMPPGLVASWLGITDPLRLEKLLPPETAPGFQANHFLVEAKAITADFRFARILARTGSGLLISVIAPLGELADLEPAVGKLFRASIPPEMIFPSDLPLPMANRIAAKCLGIVRDEVTFRARFAASGGEIFSVSLDAACQERELPGKDEETWLYFPAQCVKLAESRD